MKDLNEVDSLIESITRTLKMSHDCSPPPEVIDPTKCSWMTSDKESVCKKLLSPRPRSPSPLDNIVSGAECVGCSERTKKKELPQPQINAHVSAKKWKGNTWKRCPDDPKKFECLLCNKVGKYGTIQQHCKQHFIPEYHCEECGDSWHIKTQWSEHFLYKCPQCQETIKGKQNLKTHMKKH